MPFSAERPSWPRDGADWPNREASGFVRAGGLDWHVQRFGRGPDLLMLHGTGAAGHSWRDVAPRLADHYRVIVPDLPGHGFTSMPTTAGLSLRGMARGIAALVEAIGARPFAGVGHSAGAAILVAMALERRFRPEAIVSVNGALLPIRHSSLFAPLARLLFLNPLAPRLFALRARNSEAIRRLIEGTGSRLDARGLDLYGRLLRRAGHIEGALGMMANWDLDWLVDRLHRLETPLFLIATSGDRAVPRSDAEAVLGLAPTARRVAFDPGGHLAHEEFPEEMARCLEDILITLPRDDPHAEGSAIIATPR